MRSLEQDEGFLNNSLLGTVFLKKKEKKEKKITYKCCFTAPNIIYYLKYASKYLFCDILAVWA